VEERGVFAVEHECMLKPEQKKERGADSTKVPPLHGPEHKLR